MTQNPQGQDVEGHATRRLPHWQRALPAFYGWYIVGIAFLSLFIGAGNGGFTFSIFLPAMNADLGWSRSTIVAASSLAAITMAAAGPFFGRIIDRRGARLVLTLSLLAVGLAQVAAAFVTEPWQFYLAVGLVAGAARSVVSSVGPGAMIAQWFRRRRAFAYGVAAMGPPVANVLFPPLVAVLVAGWGWRAGWVGLGVMALVLGLAPSFLIVRHRPEDLGLLPDGGQLPLVGKDGETPPMVPDAEDWTASEALHSRGFWTVAAAQALILLAPNVSIIFMYSYLTSKGLDASSAAAAVSAVSGIQVVTRMGFWMPAIARIGSVRRVVLLWGAILLCSTLLLALAEGEVWAYVAAAVLGLGLGGNLVLQLQIWPEYFGRAAVGTITGTSQGLQGITSSTVPLLLAALLDRTGSYTALYLIVSAFVLMGLALHVIVGKPRRPVQPLAGDRRP